MFFNYVSTLQVNKEKFAGEDISLPDEAYNPEFT